VGKEIKFEATVSPTSVFVEGKSPLVLPKFWAKVAKY